MSEDSEYDVPPHNYPKNTQGKPRHTKMPIQNQVQELTVNTLYSKTR